MPNDNKPTVPVTHNLVLTNSQMVASRKLASVAKRGATKGQDANGFAIAALNQVLLTRYEAYHKGLALLEGDAFDKALAMGAQFPEGVTRATYLATRLQESADILADLQAGGARKL